ncbi:hypothetical protein [Photobacterium piscicola]|uniref:Uncharacterized protein n=1 Tax=Photobacterium piscicola TaxID=1378299 RepID=A0ABU6LLR6_9GAMM|nr:hypothetical protein [Photobacterium piscicola]MEC6884198.1 hypothetical protein [Photobacterium piscicola]MEC6900508.1 hypothetical protein [Photobacterium piscicola]MEC6909734.1 hypothetical protein [Photobacterium piscicola]
MAAHSNQQFHVGQIIDEHPFVAGDGAVIEMFRNDMSNIVFIGLTGITAEEQQMMAEATAEFGLMKTENGGCLVVFKLAELAFDIQFNAAAIPNEYFQQPTTSTLALSMMALDTSNNELKVIRELSLPEAVTQQIIEVMTIQRAIEDLMAVNAENMHLLNTVSTEELLEKITLTPIQTVIAPSCSCGHRHDDGHHHH